MTGSDVGPYRDYSDKSAVETVGLQKYTKTIKLIRSVPLLTTMKK